MREQVTLDLPEKTMGITDGKGEMVTVSSDGSVFWSRQARFTLALDFYPGAYSVRVGIAFSTRLF